MQPDLNKRITPNGPAMVDVSGNFWIPSIESSVGGADFYFNVQSMIDGVWTNTSVTQNGEVHHGKAYIEKN